MSVYATTRELARDAFGIFSERGARLLSASIAFYALLSIVPILVIALNVASLVVDPGRLDSTVHAELTGWVGASGANAVLRLVAETQQRTESSLTNLLGIGVLVYASTRLFSQMMRALDLLWGADPGTKPEGLLERARDQVKKRMLSFAMVLFVGLLLVATVLVHVGLAAARHAVGLETSLPFRVVEGVASFAITVALFSLVFGVLPRVRVTTGDALVGGAVTALLFTLGSLVVTAYVTHKDMSVYGAASALVMLMLWAHYNAQVFFLGAAFTVAHARRRGA